MKYCNNIFPIMSCWTKEIAFFAEAYWGFCFFFFWVTLFFCFFFLIRRTASVDSNFRFYDRLILILDWSDNSQITYVDKFLLIFLRSCVLSSYLTATNAAIDCSIQIITIIFVCFDAFNLSCLNDACEMLLIRCQFLHFFRDIIS